MLKSNLCSSVYVLSYSSLLDLEWIYTFIKEKPAWETERAAWLGQARRLLTEPFRVAPLLERAGEANLGATCDTRGNKGNEHIFK